MIWIVVGIVIGIIVLLFVIYKVAKILISNQLFKMFGVYVENEIEVEINKEYLKKKKEYDIDDIVYNDLELDQLFKMINHTYTNVGKEYMYAQLFSSDINNNQFEGIMNNWEDKKKLKATLYELYHLSKEYSESLDLFQKMRSIQSTDIYMISFSFLLLIGIIVLSFVVGLDILMFLFLWVAIQMVSYSHYTRKTDDAMSHTFSYCELVYCLERLSKLDIFSKEDSDKIKMMTRKSKKYTYLYRACQLISKIDIFFLMEFVKGMFFIPYFQCIILKKHKNELINDLYSIYRYVGMVDVSLSIYGLRMNYETCLPNEITKPKINFKDCYHPEIKNAVKNSFSSDSSCIITGTNASGKSTFLKTVGLNMVMARSFHTCFASEFDYYPFQLCSSIHMKDDLESGDSYYVKEIKIMKHILDSSKEKICLILIDEILRGTNEKERIAISRAVLNHLFHTKSVTLVTTHDLDLVESFPDMKQYCFHDDVRDNMLYCDYTIKEGICKVGNAIRLLEVHHYDQNILDQIKKPT